MNLYLSVYYIYIYIGFSFAWISNDFKNRKNHNEILPPGKLSHNYGKTYFFHGKIHYKCKFSIALLNYRMGKGIYPK